MGRLLQVRQIKLNASNGTSALRGFEALARHLNFAQAAVEVGISQPAMTCLGMQMSSRVT